MGVKVGIVILYLKYILALKIFMSKKNYYVYSFAQEVRKIGPCPPSPIQLIPYHFYRVGNNELTVYLIVFFLDNYHKCIV